MKDYEKGTTNNNNPYYGATQNQQWKEAPLMESDNYNNSPLNEQWDTQMRLGFIRKVY